MREATHYIFSIGISLSILSVLGMFSLVSVVLSLWLSFSVNYAIDLLGHLRRNGIPSRSWITHSIFTGPIWGIAIGGFSGAGLLAILGTEPKASVMVLWASIGALIALGHLLLDSLTGAGVYFTRNRIALAHFKYDNLALNLAFIVAGILLVGVSVRH